MDWLIHKSRFDPVSPFINKIRRLAANMSFKTDGQGKTYPTCGHFLAAYRVK